MTPPKVEMRRRIAQAIRREPEGEARARRVRKQARGVSPLQNQVEPPLPIVGLMIQQSEAEEMCGLFGVFFKKCLGERNLEDAV